MDVERLLPPVTYQGGKQRLAAEIVKRMAVPRSAIFYDLCCGSGAVSIALVESGHPPDQIVMVDQGWWGAFWRRIGDGGFDMRRFRKYVDDLPTDPRQIKTRVEEWYRAPVDPIDGIYVWLLLQAAAIGGAPVASCDGRWRRNSGFRDYWLPTMTSSRRSPVNPMMPMPATIIKRVEALMSGMRGVRGIDGDAAYLAHETRRVLKSVVYIDPDYAGTTGYGHSLDPVKLAKSLPCPCWVSEGTPLSKDAVRLSTGRAKGGMTGGRKRAANEEWLSRLGG